MNETQQVQPTFQRLRVRIAEEVSSGHQIYSLDGMTTGDTYTVVAIYVHKWNGEVDVPCFLLDTPQGIQAKACKNFTVVTMEPQPRPAPPMIDVAMYAAHCVDSMGDIFYDAQPDVDGYGPQELREQVEESVAYIIRRVMRALGHDEGTTATLTVNREMAATLREKRARLLAIDELVDENPDTPQPKDNDEREDLFEESAEIERELALMIIDLMPTMEVYN